MNKKTPQQQRQRRQVRHDIHMSRSSSVSSHHRASAVLLHQIFRRCIRLRDAMNLILRSSASPSSAHSSERAIRGGRSC
jgi:hypothetical protein